MITELHLKLKLASIILGELLCTSDAFLVEKDRFVVVLL
jgi:hypothetical protein